jgi:hypothetical protein
MGTPDPVEIGQSSYSAFEPVYQRPQQSTNTTAPQPTAFPSTVQDNQLIEQNVLHNKNMLRPRPTDFQEPADQHARPIIDRRTSQDGLPLVSIISVTNINVLPIDTN